MRFRKYKCSSSPFSGWCGYGYNDAQDDLTCSYCGLTKEQTETIWEQIEDVWLYKIYFKYIPHAWRPGNVWYKFKCWGWKRYTTVKPRNLDHTWCDRTYLLPTMVFEIACQFIEREGPKTQEEWDWQKEHNPAFYASWTETKQICDWWQNVCLKDYSWNIDQEFLDKAKRLIELSPWYWT